MPLRNIVACVTLIFACGDDVAECPSPSVRTPNGCELADGGAEDVNARDVNVPDVNEGDASESDAAVQDAMGPGDAGNDSGLVEVCNGLDDDGDERIDEGLALETFYRDGDEDGFGAPDDACMACEAATCGDGVWVADNTDCNDACHECFPGRDEVCDESDNDCDDAIDEGVTQRYFEDHDRDGFGSSVFVDACRTPDGFAVDDGDCADMEPSAYPGSMTYRAEPMGNPPTSGLAHDYDCDGVETHEIFLEGNPGEVCSRPSCPELDRWEVRPACGGFSSVFRCFSIATNCRALESSEDRARCR